MTSSKASGNSAALARVALRSYSSMVMMLPAKAEVRESMASCLRNSISSGLIRGISFLQLRGFNTDPVRHPVHGVHKAIPCVEPGYKYGEKT
jgi:hypothetical protein